MGFKESLDRYLTTPPDDGFDNWAEEVGNAFSDEFYTKNEWWFDEYNGQYNKWLNELFRRGIGSSDSSKIIERAFNMYVL